MPSGVNLIGGSTSGTATQQGIGAFGFGGDVAEMAVIIILMMVQDFRNLLSAIASLCEFCGD